jgi:glycosyltransferase involved in cell wall biosynthesis
MTDVLVNLLWLVPGVVGGSEESTTAALRAVAEDPPSDLSIRLAVLEPFARAHPDLAEAFPVHVADLDGRDKRRRVLAEQTWLDRLTRARRADVVHHAGGVVPLRHPGRVLLTVHDLQPLDLPANFTLAKRLYIRAMAGRSVAAADVVAVPSRFTRDRVIALTAARQQSVRVVPWSVPAVPDAGPEPFPLPTGLGDGPFLLAPAITYPHKNHAVLLEAMALLAPRHPELQLVCTGGVGSMEGELRRRMSEPDLAGRVLRTGRVPATQLESLFAAAAAVVVPSRYEGFGLPVLEAMVRGVPVIAARAGSLPEVARPEDLVDPDDVAGWARAVEGVLEATPDQRSARIDAGRRRAASFTPARTAAALVDCYRRAAGTLPPGDPTDSTRFDATS